MTEYHRNNKLTTGLNNGADPANAWQDQTTQFRDIGSTPLVAGDIVRYADDSGPYYDAFSSDIVNRRADISFDATAKEIRTVGGDFSLFSAGQFIKVLRPAGTSGDARNLGLFEIASVLAGAITLVSTHNLFDEAAGSNVTVTSMAGFNVSAFDMRTNGGAGNPIVWDLRNNLIHGGVTVDANSGLAYFPSGTNGEYYVARADGSNPGFQPAESVLLDGHHMILAAGIPNDQLGIVGSLEVGFAGFGDSDGLGFDTVYIKKNSTPTTSNTDLDAAQLQHGAETNSRNHKWTTSNKGVKCPLGRMGHFNVAGLNNKSDTGEWEGEDIAFTYINLDAVRSGFTGTATDSVTRLKKCVGYRTGHRFGNLNFPGAILLENCIDLYPHLTALMGNGTDATSTLDINNHIGSENEAGSIDKKSAVVTLSETHNHFFPLMVAAGGDLGYVTPANWPITDSTDNPASTATNKNATMGGLGRANYPELKDPQFNFVDSGIYENCDFRLRQGSPCINTGTPIAGITLDAAGNPYDEVTPNKGIYAGFVVVGGPTLTAAGSVKVNTAVQNAAGDDIPPIGGLCGSIIGVSTNPVGVVFSEDQAADHNAQNIGGANTGGVEGTDYQAVVGASLNNAEKGIRYTTAVAPVAPDAAFANTYENKTSPAKTVDTDESTFAVEP